MADSEEITDRHMQWMADCRQRLFRYVSVMVPSSADADEIVQQSLVTIWEKIDDFDQSGSESCFFAWASRIAANHAKNHVRKLANRQGHLSPEAIEAIEMRWSGNEDEWQQRHDALHGCIEALPSDDQHLIRQSYLAERTAVELAAELSRKPTSVSRSLRRIRKWLEICIERKLVGTA